MSALRIHAAALTRNATGASRFGRPVLAQAPRLGQSGRPARAIESLAALRIQQCRHHSSSTNKRKPGQQSSEPSPGQLSGFLGQTMTFRPLRNAFRGQSLKRLYRQSPEELIVALALLTGIAGVVVYVIYAYFNYFQSEQFTKFPPDVAKSMRRALYFSNYSPDPKMALKYYKMALEQCEQNGLDPFSDGVMGIKIQLAAWLEKLGSYKSSIEVLETLLRDNKKWVEKMEQAVRDGLVDVHGNLLDKEGNIAEVPKKPAPEGETTASSPDAEETETENMWGKRTRVLGKSVGISVKLGELYADEHVLEGDNAGERLIWAVETVLRELQRRQVEGVKEGEGEWMSPEQIGGALEALANHYEAKSQHYLAAPLYLQAVTLSPPKACHTAVLMNNLAISLAQQPITPPESGVVASTGQDRPTRASLLASARAWALQAHATGSKVEGDDRTAECDEACAVALCNLGEIAAMSGDMEEARSRFKQSHGLSKRISFEPGISQALECLDAVSIGSNPKSS